MKGSINNSVKHKTILEFEKIFEGENPLKPEDYLKGGNKNIVLNAATLFLGFKNQDSVYSDPEKVLNVFFSKANTTIKKSILEKINKIRTNGEEVVIINTISSLWIFEYFFQKSIEGKAQNDADFEINFFKAYLAFNTQFTTLQNTAEDSTKKLDVEIRLPAQLFTLTYAYSDKENYDINKIWITQTLKSMHLFRFLEGNKKTKPLLNAFLSYYGAPSWQDYLKKLIPLTTPALQNDNETFTNITIPKGDDFKTKCEFLEKLTIPLNEDMNTSDFISLRMHPFYKVNDGVYQIIFNLFVVEKIFKGLYFQFRNINEQLPKQEKISELKSFFGYEFSEKVLTYNVLESIYTKESCISFSGEELSKKNIDAAPDYYIRKGKNILVFESKDFLIPADAKGSFDFNIYESEFTKKLYFEEREGKEVPKAVMQLIGFIKKLLKKEFSADQDYHYREVNIYPVLLTHDYQYDVIGFNAIINNWFHEELELLNIEDKLFINRVKPLVVVNIDTLIYHKSVLQENKLHDIINEYVMHINKKITSPKIPSKALKNILLSKFISFSTFVEKMYPPKSPVPEAIKSFLPTLVDEDK